MGALAADDGRLVSTFHVGLAIQQKWVESSAAHSCFVRNTHKTQQAVNPQLDTVLRFPVNYLGTPEWRSAAPALP
jgi:hypothetical protein